jgi:prepilin-type processing-associated H-X9-DG protein
MNKHTTVQRIPQFRRRIKSAFTLIELLIVVAIIMMLSSLLLAALSSAKEAGRRAACAGNMRQLALMAIIYSHDNSGFAPSLVNNSAAASGVGVVAPVSINPLAGGGNGGGGSGGGSGGGGGGGGSTGGGGTGGPGCSPDQYGMTYICHIPPGNPSAQSTEYVGFSATGPTGHENHSGDECRPCAGYIGAYWNNFLDNLFDGYLAATLGSGSGFNVSSCPSDQNPEYVLLIDEAGNAHHFPCSYNENLEFAMTKTRIERVAKPAATILFYDGRPSNMIGDYNISKYNSKYASFRHLHRVNAAYVDGHVESLPAILQREIQLY